MLSMQMNDLLNEQEADVRVSPLKKLNFATWLEYNLSYQICEYRNDMIGVILSEANMCKWNSELQKVI